MEMRRKPIIFTSWLQPKTILVLTLKTYFYENIRIETIWRSGNGCVGII